MGRTIPSYRIATEIEKRKWKPSREATLVAMFIPVPLLVPCHFGSSDFNRVVNSQKV
jgi:hypothetical protein